MTSIFATLSQVAARISRRLLTAVLLLIFVSACGSRQVVRTSVDEKSKNYACIDPALILEQDRIGFILYERLAANEKTTTQSCRSVTVAEKLATGSSNPLVNVAGAAFYVGLSVFSLGLYTAADLSNMDSKCNTDKTVVTPVDKRVDAKGRFTGKILVVPINYPESVSEQSFDGNIQSINLPLGRTDSQYAVQVKGSYKSANVQCDVDLQQVVKRE